jgi:hypothetical protein
MVAPNDPVSKPSPEGDANDVTAVTPAVAANETPRSEQPEGAAELPESEAGKKGGKRRDPDKPRQPEADDRDNGPLDARSGGKRRKDGSRSKRSPERTCLVTRETKSPDTMVRFVLSPEGVVTPDVNGKLPGRGVWLTATIGTVREAVRRNVFSRGFKTQASTPEDLPEQVDAILTKFVLGQLGMARASGAVITGFAKVDQMIRSNEAWLVLEANDAAADGRGKIAQACRANIAMGGEPPHIYELFSTDELSNAISARDEGSKVVHMALGRAQNARSSVKKIERLATYRGVAPVDVTPGKGSNSPKTE